MASRHRYPLGACGLTALCLLLALTLFGASPAAAGKKGAACDRWGKSTPDQLEVDQARSAIRCLLNKRRRSAGLPALEESNRLETAAQRHTERMDGTGCFDHECPGEPTLETRLEGVNYLIGSLLRWAIGENLAWGEGSRGTPKSIVAAWMDSPGHRANILNRSFRQVGVGFSRGTPESGNASGGIYTTDFGLRVD